MCGALATLIERWHVSQDGELTRSWWWEMSGGTRGAPTAAAAQRLDLVSSSSQMLLTGASTSVHLSQMLARACMMTVPTCRMRTGRSSFSGIVWLCGGLPWQFCVLH